MNYHFTYLSGGMVGISKDKIGLVWSLSMYGWQRPLAYLLIWASRLNLI